MFRSVDTYMMHRLHCSHMVAGRWCIVVFLRGFHGYHATLHCSDMNMNFAIHRATFSSEETQLGKKITRNLFQYFCSVLLRFSILSKHTNIHWANFSHGQDFCVEFHIQIWLMELVWSNQIECTCIHTKYVVDSIKIHKKKNGKLFWRQEQISIAIFIKRYRCSHRHKGIVFFFFKSFIY